MSKKKGVELSDVKSEVDAAVAAWIEENAADPETIKSRVFDILDKRLQEVVGKLLGFDVRWSRDWEVDHCNGRAGNSAAGDFLRKQAKGAVDEWLLKQAKGLPDLPAKAVASLKREYQDTLDYEVRARAKRMAKDRAVEIADGLFASATAVEEALDPECATPTIGTEAQEKSE